MLRMMSELKLHSNTLFNDILVEYEGSGRYQLSPTHIMFFVILRAVHNNLRISKPIISDFVL